MGALINQTLRYILNDSAEHGGSMNVGRPTSDDIEVRIIGTESTNNEDTPIELLEI